MNTIQSNYKDIKEAYYKNIKETYYKDIKDAYKAIKDDDRIEKSKEYYTSVDTATGSYQDASKVAGRILNDLNYLDMRGNLCGSFEVKLKHNNHDFGGYYSIEIYSVELDTDSDELYDIVQDYQEAGQEQIELIIKKNAV